MLAMLANWLAYMLLIRRPASQQHEYCISPSSALQATLLREGQTQLSTGSDSNQVEALDQRLRLVGCFNLKGSDRLDARHEHGQTVSSHAVESSAPC